MNKYKLSVAVTLLKTLFSKQKPGKCIEQIAKSNKYMVLEKKIFLINFITFIGFLPIDKNMFHQYYMHMIYL